MTLPDFSELDAYPDTEIQFVSQAGTDGKDDDSTTISLPLGNETLAEASGPAESADSVSAESISPSPPPVPSTVVLITSDPSMTNGSQASLASAAKTTLTHDRINVPQQPIIAVGTSSVDNGKSMMDSTSSKAQASSSKPTKNNGIRSRIFSTSFVSVVCLTWILQWI
jgi:hypothetical protein